MNIRKLTRLFLTIAGLSVLGRPAFGQVSISGSTCNVAGGSSGYQYSISGAWQSSDNVTWTITGGVIAGTSNTSKSGTIGSIGPSIRVVWNSNPVSPHISLYESRLGSTSLYVTVITIPATVSPSSQVVNYGSSVTLTGGTPGSGCFPAYSFWWETAASSSGPFSTVAGAAGQNLTINPFTQKAYYRRALSFVGDVVYSNTALVDIAPLNVGSISASITSLNYNSQPSISQTPASGGNCGSPVYEWQQSIDGGPWKPVGSTAAYPSGAPAVIGNTLIRRKIMCGDQIAFSNALSFTVNYTSANAENLNYIRTNQVVMPGVMSWEQADQLTNSQTAQSTVYFDGLGRQIQSVHKQASPLNKDLVQPVVYDNFGREINKYLPYVSAAGDGKFKSNPLAEQNSFNSTQFPGEQYYYGKVDYEPSPLNRVQTTYAPGKYWVGASRGVGLQYLINQASDSVRIWTIAAAPGSIPTTTAMYPAGTLYKTQTTDEQNHSVVEYKDKQGKVVLKKVQFASTPGTAHVGWFCTYYIYDNLDNLRFVLQPNAIDLVMLNGTWNLSSITSLTDELCFRYEYDSRNRMIIKKVPGAGEVWMVYNARDELVMTQDANLRGQGQWLYTVYDNLDRAFATGMIWDSHDRAYHAGLAATNLTYPNGVYNYTILTHTLYDDYSWIPTLPVSFTASRSTSYDGNFLPPSNSFPFPQALTQSSQTRGQVTGMRIATTAGGPMLYLINYYDDRGRLIQTQQTNITGGTDISTTQYDFSGKPLGTYLKQEKAGTNAQTHFLLTKMNYDAAGRLLTLYKNIDNAPSDQLISTNTYNELGQLQNKQLGNNLDNLAYEYNIRGWLSGINKDYVASGGSNYFGMVLGYDKSTAGNTDTQVPQFNGNIAAVVWKTAGDGVGRKYDYKYDNANRITRAEYSQNTSGSGWDANTLNFSVWGFDSDNGYGIKYDANGNIQMMIQSGYKGGVTSLVDAMHYTYYQNSNKLQQVWDNVNDPDSKLGDLHYDPTTKTSTDYEYDVNGNLITDNNKGIHNGILYNYMNLPQLIHKLGKGYVEFMHDALGNKLRTANLNDAAQPVTTTLYLGPFVYQNDTLQFVSHEEGRVRWAYHKNFTDGAAYNIYQYDFFEKDHLGNTRVVLSQEKDTTRYLASGEASYRTTEAQLFDNLTTTSVARTVAAGYPNDINFTNPNDTVFKVNGNAGGHKMGPSLLLKVMSGDKIDLGVQEYYNSGTAGTPNTSLADVLASLATGVVNITSGGKGSLADLNNTGASPIYAALNSFLTNNDPNPSGKPKAYLNWILLDEQLKYVSSYPQSGAIVVGAASTLNSLGYTGIPITKSGYLYIWVSNETPNWDVFFDNLAVKHYSGPLLEETHYYPFGLTMAGISSKALKPYYAENKYKFQKQELQNKEFSDGSGLEMYSFKYRMDDPQIGRFWQIDPLADKYVYNSTYAFSENKVTSHVELEGLEAQSITDDAWRELQSGFQHLANWVDNTFSVFNKSSTSTVVATTPVSTTSTGTTVTTSVSTNFGASMSYIIANNSNAGNAAPQTKTTTTVTADTKTDIQTPAGTITNKTTVSTGGVVTNETGAKRNVVVEGVPATLGGSVSTSTNGQTTATAQGSTNSGKVQGVGQIQYSTNGKQQSASVGVGGQTTAGKTTTTTIFGIKISW